MNVKAMAPNLFLHLTNTLEPCFEQGSVLPAEDTAAPMTEAATAFKKCVFSLLKMLKSAGHESESFSVVSMGFSRPEYWSG